MTTLTVLLSNMSAARLSIQPPPQPQQMEMECPRLTTCPAALELLPHAFPNGAAAGDDNNDPGSSPRRPDVVKFSIDVDPV